MSTWDFARLKEKVEGVMRHVEKFEDSLDSSISNRISDIERAASAAGSSGGKSHISASEVRELSQVSFLSCLVVFVLCVCVCMSASLSSCLLFDFDQSRFPLFASCSAEDDRAGAAYD